MYAPGKQEPTPNEQLPAVPQTATTPNPTEEGEQVTQKYPEERTLARSRWACTPEISIRRKTVHSVLLLADLTGANHVCTIAR